MNIRPLSKSLQEAAERELNEIPSQIGENLEQFRNWLEKQEHLRYKDDYQFLLSFLRGSKFSLERAKQKIDAYYTFRTVAPDVAQNMDPQVPELREYIEKGIALLLPLPNVDHAAPRVMLFRYADGKYDPNVINTYVMLKAGLMCFDVLFNEDDNFVISGLKIVWDMKNIHLRTILQTTPDLIKKLAYAIEQAFPTRLKSVYIINMPKPIEQIMNFLKRLVSKKLAKRIHFYATNNLESIYNDIPKSILPHEYGGNAGYLKDLLEVWKKTIERNRERLLKEDNYYSEESKRTERSKSLSSIFGVEGSFRELQLD